MDPLSITVTVLTLATSCVQFTTSLYQIIDSFNSRKRDVQYLKTEVGDLNVVLQTLEKHITESKENFEVLRLVLKHCAQACKDFESAIQKALGNSKGSMQDIRMWARLQYGGYNINEFRKLLNSYKATTTIALADANLRTARVTKALVQEFTTMTKTTTEELEEQITELSTKLEMLQSGPICSPSDNLVTSPEAKHALDQKASLEQCLTVCHQLLAHIEEYQPSILEDVAQGEELPNGLVLTEEARKLAPRLTTDALTSCAFNINTTIRQLQMLGVENKSTSGREKAQILQQLDSARQCLGIIEQAQQHRVNSFEKIDTAEDSLQAVVSTIGDLIKVSGLTVGARSINIMGQMSDETVQKLGSRSPLAGEQSLSIESEKNFNDKYGSGRTFNRER